MEEPILKTDVGDKAEQVDIYIITSADCVFGTVKNMDVDTHFSSKALAT